MAKEQGINDIGLITVEVGEVSGSDVEEIVECFDFLKSQVPEICRASISIVPRKARAKCRRCGTEFGTESGGRCPACGSLDVELVGGEEARVVSVGRRVE
jgi:hydrogenase nickel incorporation protein HypA/HybF